MKPYALFFATNRRFLFALAVLLMSLKDKSPKVLEKADVLVYHCAGGGVRFWTYTWNGPWQKYYQEYLKMGGEPHTDKEHAWLKFIKKYNLQRFKFFDRSPDPQMHPHRFLKYVLTYPFKYGFKK